MNELIIENVTRERNELDIRVARLTAFIQLSPVFGTLSTEMKFLLRHQLLTMNAYMDILNRRLILLEKQ